MARRLGSILRVPFICADGAWNSSLSFNLVVAATEVARSGSGVALKPTDICRCCSRLPESDWSQRHAKPVLARAAPTQRTTVSTKLFGFVRKEEQHGAGYRVIKEGLGFRGLGFRIRKL